jgi:ribose transport system substrate-binding protein
LATAGSSDWGLTRKRRIGGRRYGAFKKTIAEDYPEIKIVAEQGIREPDFYGDADRAAYVIMTANQNLSGI